MTEQWAARRSGPPVGLAKGRRVLLVSAVTLKGHSKQIMIFCCWFNESAVRFTSPAPPSPLRWCPLLTHRPSVEEHHLHTCNEVEDRRADIPFNLDGPVNIVYLFCHFFLSLCLDDATVAAAAQCETWYRSTFSTRCPLVSQQCRNTGLSCTQCSASPIYFSRLSKADNLANGCLHGEPSLEKTSTRGVFSLSFFFFCSANAQWTHWSAKGLKKGLKGELIRWYRPICIVFFFGLALSILLCLPVLVFRKLHFFSRHFSPRDTFSTDALNSWIHFQSCM